MIEMGKVNHHSQMKHRLLGMYLSICSRFVKSQRSHEFVVVDMYANDGLSRWSSGDQEWEGSAKIIAKWVSKAGENSYCIFNESNPELIQKLKKNTQEHKNVIKKIYCGDANIIFNQIINEHIPIDAHSIFLLDPYTHSQLKFSTVEKIARHSKEGWYQKETFTRRPELIINLPTFTILKSKTQNPELITEFFGTDHWIDALKNAEKKNTSQPEALLEIYKSQLLKYYNEDGIVSIQIRTLESNAPIYYLIFAATHPVAKKIHKSFVKWFDKNIKDFRKEGFRLKLEAECRRQNILPLEHYFNS